MPIRRVEFSGPTQTAETGRLDQTEAAPTPMREAPAGPEHNGYTSTDFTGSASSGERLSLLDRLMQRKLGRRLVGASVLLSCVTLLGGGLMALGGGDDESERIVQPPVAAAPPAPGYETRPLPPTQPLTPELATPPEPLPPGYIEQLRPGANFEHLLIPASVTNPSEILAGIEYLRAVGINNGREDILRAIHNSRGGDLLELDLAIMEDMQDEYHHGQSPENSDRIFTSDWGTPVAVQETRIPTQDPTAPFTNALLITFNGEDKHGWRGFIDGAQSPWKPYTSTLMFIPEEVIDPATGESMGRHWKIADGYTSIDDSELKQVYSAEIN